MDTAYLEELQALVGAEGVLENELMSAHTTFHIGGPADVLVVPTNVESLLEVLACSDAHGVPWRILGHGSNLLVSDEGVRGAVVMISGNLSDVGISEDGVVTALAGSSNAKVATLACRAGLAGFEFAAGIPGTIGGAAIMNAGAYGGEFKDVAQSVRCLDGAGNAVTVEAADADWSYRHSMMGDSGMVVLSATLQLYPDDPEAIKARMDDLAQRRISKQPLELPSAGSTFKRPEGHFAGKLIQDAGMQGYQVGGAQVSTKHAGFVVNVGGATACDVLQVIDDVREAVLAQFGIELEPEVKLWGFE